MMCLFVSRVRKFAIIFAKQFSGRRIIEAKTPEPGGGCNLEHSRMRRAID
jgi:hypothetical protein